MATDGSYIDLASGSIWPAHFAHARVVREMWLSQNWGIRHVQLLMTMPLASGPSSGTERDKMCVFGLRKKIRLQIPAVDLERITIFIALVAACCSLIISSSSNGEDGPLRNANQNDKEDRADNAKHDGTVGPNDIPSADEGKKFAESLLSALEKNDVERAKPLFDFDQFFDRVVGDDKYSDNTRREIIDDLREPVSSPLGGIGGIVRSPLDRHQKCLRVRNRDGMPHALVRLVRDEDPVGYLELRLSRNAEGAVVANDVYIYGAGEYYSTIYRQLYLTLKSSSFDGEKGMSDEQAAIYDSLLRMTTAANEGRFADGLAEYSTLPMDVQSRKMVLLLRAKLAMQLDVKSAAQAMTDLRRLYPDDPGSNLLLVDYYALQQRFRDSLQCIDLLDKSVGGDPYLHVVRASAHLASRDFRAARRSAEMAVAAEPEVVQARLTLISCALRQKDFAEVARQLLVMENELEQEIADLTKVSGYGEFVRSREYRTWMAQRRPASKTSK